MMVKEAEIIDVTSTIADSSEASYQCEGRSIFTMKLEDKFR